jgi:hypothetical protein
MLCKRCSSTHMEYNKIGVAFFWFFCEFLRILQTLVKAHKRGKNLITKRSLETFRTSQEFPRFAQKTLERSHASQCGP